MVTRMTLSDGWTLTSTGGTPPAEVAAAGAVPAAVPGTVHTDLLAAGLIPDPYLERNEELLSWTGRTDWRYRTTIAADAAEPAAPGERVDLVLEGVDTVAVVSVGGTEVARTANMHRSYRVDLRAVLGGGETELAVDLPAQLTAAERLAEELGPRPNVYPHPFNAVRKMACNFGWDWGPELVTAGLWKPVRLERWRTARLERVRPLVTFPDGPAGAAVVAVHVDVERASAEASGRLRATATLRSPAGTGALEHGVPVLAGESSAVVELRVEDPQLWWPHGYGEQPLYALDVRLEDAEAAPLDEWSSALGLRDLVLDTGRDELGAAFTFGVNGQPVFAKGANWIPDDCFPHRVDRARYERRVDQARRAGMNMLRVWGGGFYESDDFYAACDEAGVMVWQDFLFACAAYGEEEPQRSEVEAEARENVARLVPHPSLVLWNGCNENIWGREIGWFDALEPGQTWGEGFYLDLLPRVVAEVDPTRPYSAGSPWSLGAEVDGRPVHPNDPDHGTVHEWEVWNRRDYAGPDGYRGEVPRFAAEFGWQGPPTWSTLTRAITEDPLTPTSPTFLVHQKAEDGNAKLQRGIDAHLPEPTTFEAWHWATQLVQARALALGLQHYRSWWPRTAGALLWQINDCWPVTSWAAVDGDGRLKPLWYAVRASFADRLLTLQPRDGAPALVAVNDTASAWTTTAAVRWVAADGTVLASAEVALEAAPRATATAVLPAAPEGTLVVVADAEGAARAVDFLVEDREGLLPVPELDVVTTAAEGGVALRVTARTLVRDLAVLADKVDPAAEVSDMLLTLLPGETVDLLVRTSDPVAQADPDAFAARGVLVSAGDLVRDAAAAV